MAEGEFWGGDFGEIDEQPNEVATARAERIAAARKAATQYQAKVEEPQWFMKIDKTAPIHGPHRPDLFVVHQLYLDGSYTVALEKGLALLASERGRKKVGSEDVELMDLIMRSALRRPEAPSDEVVAVAKRFRDFRTTPTFGFTAAKVLRAASSSSQVEPLEPLQAVLVALTRHSSLTPYLELLSSLLTDIHPLLDDVLRNRQLAGREAEVQAEVDSLNLVEEDRKTLEKVLGLHGEVKEDQDDALRDVRSL